MKRIVFVILAISVLLAFPLAAALAQSGCAARHTVQFGENLFRIGLKYGLAWTVLQSANGLTNPNHIFVGQVLCIPAILPPVTFPPARTATPTIPATAVGPAPTRTATPVVVVTPVPALFFPVPTFRISAVVRDQSVTISAINFPVNTAFDVLMGAYGTQGVGGAKAGTQASGNGSFTAMYTIPANLKGADKIAIRLQSATGYFSYNWFHNQSATVPH
ncbi:MAG TPA: LysM peptidoglycan-binding domain-containing protein [Anaerolineales bacterium]|nr:LysM peptidoglycan-binding domain-containing protein [Anaerolineales bacterium]